MRDSHRMKEKYDLSLDSRQVVSLLVAGIVVLGAVFVLGVLVGKKLAGGPRADRSTDLLSSLDQKSAALERARSAPPLTFQEELTADGGTARPAAPLKAVAEKKLEPPARPAEPTVRSPEPKAEPPKAVAERKPETALKPADGGSVATRTTPAAPPAPAKAASKPPEGTAGSGAFTLQLGASQNREDAERMVSRLREKGYAPYIVAATVPGKGTFYRVRMGSFATREAADRYLEDFKRETKSEAFVASTK
jgi:cell division septation protein DedD